MEAQPIPKDSLSLFVDSLDPALHSGLYYDENQKLCLGTPDVNALTDVINSKNMNSVAEFTLVPTTYSWKDMDRSQKLLLEQRQQYNITAVGFDIENNGLAIFVPEANTRSSNDFSSVTNLPVTVVSDKCLGISNSMERQEQFEDLPSEEIIESRAVTLRSGSFIGRSAGTRWSSLAAWALTNDDKLGIVTCGHGWTAGSNAYYGTAKIGTSAKVKTSGSVDATVLKTTSDLNWGGYYNGQKIDLVANPVVNDSVVLLGANGTQRGNVKYVNISGDFQDGYYTDLFCFNFEPIAGDSGGAIIALRDTSKVLIGINKSKWWTDNDLSLDTTTWGTGCKSFNIENALGFDFANRG